MTRSGNPRDEDALNVEKPGWQGCAWHPTGRSAGCVLRSVSGGFRTLMWRYRVSSFRPALPLAPAPAAG